MVAGDPAGQVGHNESVPKVKARWHIEERA
jgi:hypothetical protein